jgi:hypothetical protein
MTSTINAVSRQVAVVITVPSTEQQAPAPWQHALETQWLASMAEPGLQRLLRLRGQVTACTAGSRCCRAPRAAPCHCLRGVSYASRQ